MTMRNSLLALLVTLCGAAQFAVVADANTGVVSVDLGIEASAETLLMPSSTAGSVVLTCDECASRSYRLSSQTTYFIGERAVGFAEFGAYLRTAARHAAVVYVKPDGSEVTRLRVSTTAPKGAGQ
jgi:hypothetical protein